MEPYPAAKRWPVPALRMPSFIALTKVDSIVAWLTFTAGIVIGALTIAATILVAWQQRVIQLHDRARDRESRQVRMLERREHQERVAKREQWRPDYEAIRKHLDRGETLAYRVLHEGPFTTSEFKALDVATFRMKSEILAGRGVDNFGGALLALACKVDDLTLNAIADRFVPSGVNVLDPAVSHALLRRAALQDRAARDLAELIRIMRDLLRKEWGD
jgi:hypothetical protein